MEGVDLEEANRIRQALGLKPIDVPGNDTGLTFKDGESASSADQAPNLDTLEGRHAVAHDNWLKLETSRVEAEQRQKRKADLKRQRDAAQRVAKLSGKGLGDFSEGEDLEDTKAWLLKSRKRRKRIEADRASKLAREKEEESKTKKTYTTADLAGLKVGHEMDKFTGEGEQVLTLKDVTVGGDESEEDELENLELRDKEKTEANLRNKKKALAYDPNSTEDGNFLAHYDEEISGPRKAHFSLQDLGQAKEDVDMRDSTPSYLLYEDVMDKKRSKRRARAKALADTLRNATEAPIPDEEGGLIVDETTEFVSALRAAGTEGATRRRPNVEDKSSAKGHLGPTLQTTEPVGTGSPMEDAEEEVVEESKTKEVESTDLFAEETIGTGLGSTLSMLSSRGLLEKTEAEKRNELLRQRQRFLSIKQTQEAEAEQRARRQREDDRKSGKFDRMTAREKEAYSQNVNTQRDLADARKLAEEFDKHYKPDIELKYVDEYGQVLSNPKDAFKHLSHIFHGKGSGNKKTEKRLKKIADEKRKESESIMDSSKNTGSMDSAAMNRAKNNRQAGVRFA